MDLISAIRAHLENCSKDSANFSESQREYLESAYESLEAVLEESNVSAPPSLNLKEVWESAAAAASAKSKELSWEDFVKKIEEKNFFKGIAFGGRQYVDRLKKAKSKYESRHSGVVPDFEKEASEDGKKRAEELKKKGNGQLQAGELNGALDLYSQAISIYNGNAVFFANRSVCYCRLKQYEKAILDAMESIELDPDYVKGYNRLGTAYKGAGDLQKAKDAFQQVVDRSKEGSSSWNHCKKQIEELERQSKGADQSAARSAPGGAPGGMDMGALGSLLGGLGGGPGGLNLGDLLKNPMMAQMAQNMMSDPSAMSQMQGMMNNPDFMSNMQNMMGANPNLGNLANQMGKMDPAFMAKMQSTMSDPVRREEVMGKVMNDPDMSELKADAEVGPILERLKAQDFSAMTELMAKPDTFSKLTTVLKKHIGDDSSSV